VIRYRWAGQADRTELLDLIAAGFTIRPDGRFDARQGQEYRILFTYLYSRPTWQPELVVVVEVDRRLVAAVGFFPQQLTMGAANLPIWAVSPVVVHPDQQGQGYGGKCLTQGLALLSARGVPAVFLWGIPEFYPKFGFVPLFPRYKTKLAKARLRQGATSIPGKLRPWQTADLPAVAALYNLRAAHLWLQPRRTFQWWTERVAEMDIELADLKEVPFPKKENLQVWENLNGETVGYLYYSDPMGKEPLTITEAAAGDYPTAAAMLVAMLERFVPPQQTIVIRGTPDHYLNMAAYRLGGTHVNPAPLAGMLKILDWPAFIARLNQAYAGSSGENEVKPSVVVPFRSGQVVWELQASPAGVKVTKANASPLVTEAQLTRMVFGLADAAEWEALPLQAQALRHFFSSHYPFIWDANYLY
jgi:predicted N-acetyltransferase YhbS